MRLQQQGPARRRCWGNERQNKGCPEDFRRRPHAGRRQYLGWTGVRQSPEPARDARRAVAAGRVGASVAARRSFRRRQRYRAVAGAAPPKRRMCRHPISSRGSSRARSASRSSRRSAGCRRSGCFRCRAWRRWSTRGWSPFARRSMASSPAVRIRCRSATPVSRQAASGHREPAHRPQRHQRGNRPACSRPGTTAARSNIRLDSQKSLQRDLQARIEAFRSNRVRTDRRPDQRGRSAARVAPWRSKVAPREPRAPHQTERPGLSVHGDG